MSDITRFEDFCRSVLTDPNGRPLVLYPEQLEMVADYFDGVRETLLLLPKKAGKSGLVGALALHHLLTTPFAETYIAAASRDQAARVLDAVHGYVRRSPALSARLKLKQREVVNANDDGFLRVLAADVDTSDGVTPSAAFVDELHRHRSAELYGLLRDGLGPRDGRMVTISTAGDSEDTPLGQLRTSALALPGLVREGARRYVRSGDAFSFTEYALEAGDDIHDMEVVKAANPAPWITLEELRERHDSPSMTPWAWQRFACGIWAQGEHAAFSPTEWAACCDPDLEIPETALGPFVGVDIGLKHDTTAIVVVYLTAGMRLQELEERRQVRPGVFERRRMVPDEDEPLTVFVDEVTVFEPRPGVPVDIDAIEDTLVEIAQRHAAPVLVLDPQFGGMQIAQRLEARLPELVLVEHSQSHGPMTKASAKLAEVIAAGTIRHRGDAALTRHVLAAGVKQVGDSWRLAKQPGGGSHIDGAVALAMAVNVGVDAVLGGDPLITPAYRRTGWSDHANRAKDAPLPPRERSGRAIGF